MLYRGPDVRISGFSTGEKAVDSDWIRFCLSDRDSNCEEQAKEDFLNPSLLEAPFLSLNSRMDCWGSTWEK